MSIKAASTSKSILFIIPFISLFKILIIIMVFSFYKADMSISFFNLSRSYLLYRGRVNSFFRMTKKCIIRIKHKPTMSSIKKYDTNVFEFIYNITIGMWGISWERWIFFFLFFFLTWCASSLGAIFYTLLVFFFHFQHDDVTGEAFWTKFNFVLFK